MEAKQEEVDRMKDKWWREEETHGARGIYKRIKEKREGKTEEEGILVIR